MKLYAPYVDGGINKEILIDVEQFTLLKNILPELVIGVYPVIKGEMFEDKGSEGQDLLIVISCLYDELDVEMYYDQYEITILPRLFAILLM